METTTQPAPRHVALRPSSRLVSFAVWSAILGLMAMVWGPMLMPVLALAAAVALLALIDWTISRGDPEPRLERPLPARMVKGRPVKLTYRLSRKGGLPVRISVLDELPAEIGGDLLIEVVERGSPATVEIARDVVPAARGIREVGPTRILWLSRLRLLQFRSTVIAGGSVAILPAAAAGRRKGLTPRSLRDELGLRPRPARGEGTDFESLRDYVSGDDPRHVDWRATARRGRLMVRQHQTERRHTVYVAVDTGRLMAGRVDGVTKLDHALDCAVALAHASREYGDRVGFIAFDRELRVLSRPKSGPDCAGVLIDATLAVEPRPWEPSYRILVETLARHQQKRALVVVLTDFVEGGASSELQSYLAVLARRHCVLLVALRDRLLTDLDQREPAITRERLYRRLALQDLAVERAAALASIRRFGAQTLDLDPAEVTVPVLNRYLAIRQAALI